MASLETSSLKIARGTMRSATEAPIPLQHGEDLKNDERWQAVQNITSTESFAKASRLSALLLYIAEKSLLGQLDEVSEQQIGINVFGRLPGYNSGDDNIVRQTARQLRQRLALFYQEEGRADTVQVSIPRGGYAPKFTFLSAETLPAQPVVLGAQSDPNGQYKQILGEAGGKEWVTPSPGHLPTPTLKGKRFGIFACGLLVGVCIAVSGARTVRYFQHRASVMDKLWSLLFTQNMKTLIVPGDAGLNMYENLDRRQVDAGEYSARKYLNTPAAQTPPGYTWSPLAVRDYTTLADLNLVVELMQLPVANPREREVRFSRDISLADLENSNAILIGAPNYDPWIQLFNSHLDFQMRYDGKN